MKLTARHKAVVALFILEQWIHEMEAFEFTIMHNVLNGSAESWLIMCNDCAERIHSEDCRTEAHGGGEMLGYPMFPKVEIENVEIHNMEACGYCGAMAEYHHDSIDCDEETLTNLNDAIFQIAINTKGKLTDDIGRQIIHNIYSYLEYIIEYDIINEFDEGGKVLELLDVLVGRVIDFFDDKRKNRIYGKKY